MSETVSLSIKGVPVALVEALKRRAARNQRSLQGELMRLVEGAAAGEASGGGFRVRDASADMLDAAQRRFGAGADGVGGVAAASEPTLLAALDAIVEGSRLGEAPLLTREQAHDRRLAREFEFDAQQAGQP